MSATNNLIYIDLTSTRYASNVAAAARQLIAALFAVKPSPAVVAEEVVTQRQQESAASWLNSMANDCERHSPNLSAELRYMASRG
ncbi:hypothetical protein Jab_2c33210 [Janthinobacterium sp. HH01]|uniref:hypothetical protein n=1 Tax=Janthinobacterium sp. HH01 TaxID=1198452 RepID=UPI0002AEC0A9|nr:hypothetical protein [Janthinobacterium sp. HH01]ELX11217.1 hypothetical protein Jab_2c33210 [Janthinobacterium sp. HH01]